jgi:hypothetical protein
MNIKGEELRVLLKGNHRGYEDEPWRNMIFGETEKKQKNEKKQKKPRKINAKKAYKLVDKLHMKSDDEVRSALFLSLKSALKEMRNRNEEIDSRRFAEVLRDLRGS